MANRRQYKHRRKWTDQMNEDLLSCKREAVALTQMEQPLLDGNGKKKGYIKLMKEIWDTKGYNDFGFSSQNLRDQANRRNKTAILTRKIFLKWTNRQSTKLLRLKRKILRI